MSYTPGFIDKIKRLGVQRLASQYTELKPSGNGMLQGRCPKPMHRDSTASFTVYTNNANGIESWYCFGCKEGGDNIKFIQWMSDGCLGFPQAVKTVADFYGITMEEDTFTSVFKKNMDDCKRYEANLTPYVKNYLYFRGMSDEDIKKWHIGFNGDYITFPIFNATSEVIGFSNRAFSQKAWDRGGKYINSSASDTFKKKDNFYGVNFVNLRHKYLFIVEGQIDAIMANKYGIENAVATMTSSLSESHINYIKSHNFTPILCYDNDDAGQKGMKKALNALIAAGVRNNKIVVLPDGRDIADLAKDMKEGLKPFVRARITSYSHYALKGIMDGLDAAIMEKQQAVLPEIRRILGSISDPDEALIARQFVSRRMDLWSA